MTAPKMTKWIVSFIISVCGWTLSDTNILTNPGFETGTTSGWSGRSCTISAVTGGMSGTYRGYATGRTATWQGIKQSIFGKVNNGQTVTISGWVRLDTTASDTIKLTVEQKDDAGTRYIGIHQTTGYADRWTQLTGTFTLNVTGTLTYLDVYFEGPASGVSFYVDDAQVLVPGSTAEAAVAIDSGVRHQMIEGFGAAGAWYEGTLVSHPQKTALYNILFRDLGLDIYRLRNTYGQSGGADYMNRSAQIIAGGEAALGRPLKVLICAWSPSAALKSNGETANGGTLKKNASNQYMYAEYGDWWADSLQAWAGYGVTADYISIQNEPDWEADWDTCRFNPAESTGVAGYNQAFDAVYDELNARMGSSMPRMIGPETTGLNGAAGYTPGQYISAMSDPSRAYGYAHHLYNINAGDNPDAYLTAMAAFQANWGSKPLFQTEYEKSAGGWPDALNMALLLHNSLAVEEVAAYFYWDLFWGGEGGLVTISSSSYTINNDYYGFKHFSAFIDDGWQRTEASSSLANLRVSAYVRGDGQKLTTVLINTSQTQAVEATFSLAGVTITGGQVYRTSASENCEALGTFNAGEPLSIPARSVVTLALDVQLIPADCAQVQTYGYRLPEDLDGDCAVGWNDLAILINQWLSQSPQAIEPNFSPDLFVDNKVDLNDLAMIMAQWMVCNDPATSGCISTW